MPNARRVIQQSARALLIGLLYLYRAAVRPWFSSCCRFYPSCSHYAEEAIRQKGIFKGMALTGKRLLKCHPFHPGGVDVPRE